MYGPHGVFPVKKNHHSLTSLLKNIPVNQLHLSLSVDQDKNAWRANSPDKSKRVLQLWATNSIGLSQYFAIESIPRFMLIDPKGKIVNLQLPYPSEYEFEEILKKELPESPGYIF